MKRCCTCKIEKQETEFHKNKPSCKICRKDERKRSYEKRKQEDYQTLLDYNKSWTKNNIEKARSYRKKWNQANVDKCRIICNKRYSYAKQARPIWADQFLIEEAYSLAQHRTSVTGIKWEVDHVLPIKGKDVCGLHVGENLQIITRSKNASKSNRFSKEYKWSDFFK